MVCPVVFVLVAVVVFANVDVGISSLNLHCSFPLVLFEALVWRVWLPPPLSYLWDRYKRVRWSPLEVLGKPVSLVAISIGLVVDARLLGCARHLRETLLVYALVAIIVFAIVDFGISSLTLQLSLIIYYRRCRHCCCWQRCCSCCFRCCMTMA